jgi:hypothetical protein
MAQERQATGLRNAFSQPTPIHPEYASLPIRDGLDWARCFRSIPAIRLCLVVLRSVRRASADLDALKAHDDAAYAEALGAGGHLYYSKGEANERRECLSFCLWESRQHAREGAGGPSRRAAAGIWRAMYESCELERYHLQKMHEGSVSFERLTA